jgi:20S proteasome subunit alpha 2
MTRLALISIKLNLQVFSKVCIRLFTHLAWKASAIGKNQENAKTFLEKRYQEDVELEDAIHVALLTLKEGFEGEMNERNIEIGVVAADRKFRMLT